MNELSCEVVERYLRPLKGEGVHVTGLFALGTDRRDKEIKFYGYGSPVQVEYQLPGQTAENLVLHTMTPGPFGHEHMADRAQVLIWSNQAFRHLPRHVTPLDVGGFRYDGTMMSVGEVEEFFLLTQYVDGEGYFRDLEQIRDTALITELDLNRTDALCDYLVELHQKPFDHPGLYTRRIRELVGHGECIMGIADSYPPHSLITSENLQNIEHRCIDWRWRLKGLTHRLRQVHGDFHPWNILFRSGIDFSLVDRSRGEFGEPADDLACLTMNYLFFSLQCRKGMNEGFQNLFLRFWDRYLNKSGDEEILRVVAPFFAFRALVMASPTWYPHLAIEVRSKLLSFIFEVLDQERFDPIQVNKYFAV